MKEHFQHFAQYNQWANDTLYAALSQLSIEELNQDLNGFFKSVIGTLNHNLVGDLMWMRRIDHGGEKLDTLDQVLHDNLEDLYSARQQADIRLGHLVDNLDPEKFQTLLMYRNTSGDDFADPISQILTHMFNHQTHHRGQCHHMLSQLGKNPPALDMIYFVRAQS